MTAPTKLIVKDFLSKKNRQEHLHRAVVGGWKDYKESSEYGKWKRKGTRASIVWERMVDRAMESFFEADGVQVREQDDTVSFVFDESLLLRLKKGDSKKLTRNYPTITALSYHHHDNDLFGYPGLYRVEVVYVLNELETEVEGVYVVAREGSKKLWDFELKGSNENILALPVTPQHPVPSKRRLVHTKIKKDKTPEKKASNDEKE